MNSIKLTGVVTDAAFDTERLINRMRLFLLTGNSILRTFLAACHATGTFFRIYHIFD